MPFYAQDQLTLHRIEQLAERLAMSNQDAAKFTLWTKQTPGAAEKPLQQRVAAFRAIHPLLWPEN